MNHYTHTLKLEHRYWDRVMSGQKPFEIRNNDRCFQTGDRVIFQRVGKNGLPLEERSDPFEITYVTNYAQQDHIVVFGIRRVRNEQDERRFIPVSALSAEEDEELKEMIKKSSPGELVPLLKCEESESEGKPVKSFNPTFPHRTEDK
jgi:hypothetical protein